MEISNGLTYELIPVEDAIGALLDGMEVFGRLYDIEREHKAYAPEVRLKARQERAKPIWEEFGRWLEDQVGLLASGSAIHTRHSPTPCAASSAWAGTWMTQWWKSTPTWSNGR